MSRPKNGARHAEKKSGRKAAAPHMGSSRYFAALWRRMKEALGAADERIATLEEAKQLVGSAGDADAYTLGDGTRWMIDLAKPKFFVCAEIDAIMAAVDLQSLREAPRAAREIQKLGGFAMPLHDFDAF